MDENFEKIKRRADSYGYNTNYGRVRDNESHSDLVKIVIAGVIVIGGFVYLKKKFKNLISNIFDPKEPELKSCNINEFHEETNENIFRKREKVFKDEDLSQAVDVEYQVLPSIYDKDHPDNITKRSYKCQF